MAQIHFNRLHSVEPLGDLFLVRALDAANNLYEWTVPREVAAMLVIALQQASTRLENKSLQTMIRTIGFQPIVADDMTPGIQIQLSDQLYLNLLMPGRQIDALLACIQQLKTDTSFGGASH
jgi:hypothetical protein